MLYRGLGKEALYAAYNNTIAVGIEQRNAYISDWEMRSEIVNNIWRPRCNIPYGSRPRQRLDVFSCLLYTSPSPRDRQKSRMPSSA